jgi:hypothetical protein
MRETIGALGGAATESEKYALKLAELKQKLDQGRISQETFNRAALDANPIFQTLKSGAEGFATTLVDGLLDGKNFVDTLKSAFDGLAKSMANAAIKDLFSGNFEKAGVEAVIAVGAKLASNFFDTSQEKELQKAKDAWAQMTERLQEFELTAQGFDLSGPASALRSLYDSAVDLAKAANAAHDMPGLVKVVQSFVAGMGRIVNEFANPAVGLSDSAQQIKRLRDQAAGLIQTLKDIGQYSDAAGSAIEGGLLKQIQAIQATLADSLRADINDATGKGFVNQINQILSKKRQLVAENNVPVELISEWFTASLQQVVDQLDASDFVKFKDTFGDLAASVHESTKAVEDQVKAQRALKDESNASARAIVDYVASLFGGSESTLAPKAKLTNTAGAYNSQIALAIGGNADAQKTITQYADAYLKAGRDVYASGAGYQAIFGQVTSQLLGLPAVTQSDDPVVTSLRDVLIAINAGNATQAKDATLQNVIKAAIDAGNATAIAALLVPKFDTLTSTTGGVLTFTQFVNGLGPSFANVATGVQVGGLLTSTQLSALGLSRDTTTGALLTNAQLTAAGLASNATVGGLLTSAQMSTLGLSSDATVGAVRDKLGVGSASNLIDIFNKIAGSDGLISKSEAIRVATQGTQSAAAGTQDNTSTTANRLNINGPSDGLGHEAQWHSQQNGILIGIQQTLKDAFVAGALTFSVGAVASVPADHNNDPVITALRKIVYNTGITAANVYSLGGKFGWPAFAQGGIASPGMSIIYGEHHPQGPFFGTVGSSPIAITPGMPRANDNLLSGATDNSEMRALREQVERLTDLVDALRRENNTGNEGIARAHRDDAQMLAGVVDRSGRDLAIAVRGEKRNPRKAA